MPSVEITDDSISQYLSQKLRHSLRYIVYKVSTEMTQIVVDKETAAASYDDFLTTLPASDCRYAVYDLPYVNQDGATRKKILFNIWTPASAK